MEQSQRLQTRMRFLEEYANVLFIAHKLQGWKLKFDNARRRYGACYCNQKYITLSKYFIQSSNVRVQDLKNILLHEVAHAMVGYKAGHGPEWKAKALEIGCDGLRCSPIHADAVPKGKIIRCPCGANNVHRYRVSKAITNMRCRHCRQSLYVVKPDSVLQSAESVVLVQDDTSDAIDA